MKKPPAFSIEKIFQTAESSADLDHVRNDAPTAGKTGEVIPSDNGPASVALNRTGAIAHPWRKGCVSKFTKSKMPNLKPSRPAPSQRQLHVTRSPYDQHAENQR